MLGANPNLHKLKIKKEKNMKLNTIEDAEEFMEVIKSCQGPVYLTDWEIDEHGNYNLQLNLKSTLSLYFGISKLLEEHGDWFEIHTTNQEDEAKLMAFIDDLKNHEGN